MSPAPLTRRATTALDFRMISDRDDDGMGSRVRLPGRVMRFKGSFPPVSLAVGPGLKTTYTVDQEHENLFSSFFVH